MDINEHYPHRTVTLLPGDTIWATYNKKSSYNEKTLKRLTGWENGQRYIGRVRRRLTEDKDPVGALVVDFYDNEKGKYQCTHVVYNIELYIVDGRLRELHHRPNPSPSLFDDEC